MIVGLPVISLMRYLEQGFGDLIQLIAHSDDFDYSVDELKDVLMPGFTH
jgi:hypothetical protein